MQPDKAPISLPLVHLVARPTVNGDHLRAEIFGDQAMQYALGAEFLPGWA